MQLRAWWDERAPAGRRPPSPPVPRAAAGANGGLPAMARNGPASAADLWSPARIAVAERVWGEGFVDPLSGEALRTLVRPLGLDAARSVLDLGAGLGGAARQIVRETGAWVTGLEPDPVLARTGGERSEQAGLARRAPVAVCDLERLALDRRYDAVIARHALFTVSRKNELIEAVRAALKPRGHFLIVDFAVKNSASNGPAIAAWRNAEPVTPHPWTVCQTTDRLKSRGFDVRAAEDMSETYAGLVLRAWERIGSDPRQLAAEPELRARLLAEGELWARRTAALAAGDLRVFRFHALTPA